MNWEAAGAVGEILGAATVVATFFYLARQVKQATSVARATARQAVSQMNVDSWGVSLDSQVLARASTKVTTGEDLSPEELGNYQRWILMRMRFVENAHYQYKQGLLDEGEWNGYANLIELIVGPTTPVSKFWVRAAVAYSPEFVDEVERIRMKA
jgi:hypothetical protein